MNLLSLIWKVLKSYARLGAVPEEKLFFHENKWNYHNPTGWTI